ncbi:tetratricopeptide repeat protein [Sphingomonas sp. LB-2]|uniref:tetratricopeptide repeat protein n=1 Tax=Sphingomonas caeni TaxID=2984949 RepID=UPI002231604E|nr:tetratricopeptide repeat protein [Sphingomonas caeni]MCW3848716.1 tetratricopeptide repeat protein [Sphingomonas caeni]
MRVFAVSAAAALMLLTVSTGLMAQRPDDQIDPKSVALVQQGLTQKASGNFDGAIDSLETALAVDPRNRAAFIGLAEIARARGLYGRAIRLYTEALALEPNDVAALRGQGEAMVQKGAVEKAKGNLARIRTICGTSPCNDATLLAAVIDKGPPASVVAATNPPDATPAKP